MILRMFLFKYLNAGLKSGPQTQKCQLPESTSHTIKSKCFRVGMLQWIITYGLPIGPHYNLPMLPEDNSSGKVLRNIMEWGSSAF